MAQKRKTRRKYKLIAFKAYHDTEADILDWWESIEEGERSDALRDLIREHLGLPARHRKRLEIPELSEVRRDILWIHDTLNDMPGYLERLVQRLVTASPQALPEPRASPQAADASEPSLSDAESQRRARRMKRATW